MQSETVWTFDTRNLRVSLELSPCFDLDLSWDESGETADKLDRGVYRAFDSIVRIVHRDTGAELGCDTLGQSIYANVDEFWTAHRDRNPMNRNCSMMRGANGQNTVICHYFPGMIAEACKSARDALRKLGALKIRDNA